MKVLPVLLMLVVILGGNFYVFYRIWQMMPPTMIGRIILVLCAVLIVAFPIISLVAGDSFPTAVTSFMYKVGTSWLILFMYLLLSFLVLDLLRITHLLPLETLMYKSWKGLGLFSLAMATLLAVGYYRYTHKARVDLPLSVQKQMPAGKPLKIVAVSDLHLGYSIGKQEFEKWIELINQEKPDIVLIAGDITDNNVVPLYEQNVAESFRKIRSTYGTYAIAGNHEYIAGISKAAEFLQSTGITLLRDSVALVDNSFYVIGRDDRSNANRQSLQELMASLDTSKPILLLDHQPYHLEEAAANGVDLQFSGHTHNGQVWPISLVTKFLFEKSHGYLQKGNTHFYVSSGLGIWGGKFRIGTRSEYVVITMNPA